jgi:hypothetical protein
MEWALPLPLLKSLVVDLNLNMPQVKGVRVDMPRPFQPREKGFKGIVTHPAYQGKGLEWASPAFPLCPLMWLSECIIFTFVRDIRDRNMKSDINIKKQTASKVQVKVQGFRVNMPRMSHSGYSGLEWASPAFRPLMWLSECIVFTFVKDIRDKDMKSDINIKNQTASKLEPMNGNVWTAIVVQNLEAGPQFFPRKVRRTSIMFVWFLKSMAHSFNLQCRT